MSFVSAGTLTTGSTTVQPAAPASMVAGNILIAFLGGNQASNLGNYTQSGGSTTWTAVDEEVSATPFCRTEIWYTICASSSDTMPTWANNSTLFAGIIAQFSGTVTLDQNGQTLGTTSPQTVTAGGTDGGTGRLIVYCRFVRAASAAVNTTSTDNVNSLGVGTGVNVLANQTASAVGHFRACYTTTATTGSVADNDVATWTMTTTAAALAIASFSSATTVNLTCAITASAAVAATNTQAVALTAPIAAAGDLEIVAPPSTPTRVQAFGNAVASGNVTASATVTVGNYLIAVLGGGTGGAGPSLSDNLGNTWTRLTLSGTGIGASAWTAPVTTGGSIVITGSNNSTPKSLAVLEVTGQNATPIDVQSSNSSLNSGTALSSGATGTPASINELAVGLVEYSFALTTGRAFSPSLSSETDETLQQTASSFFVGISDGPIASASAETFTATQGSSAGWAAWCLLIQGAAGSSTGNSQQVALTCAISSAAAVAGTLTVTGGITAITAASAPSAVVAATNTEKVAVSTASAPSSAVAGTNTQTVQLTCAISAAATVAATNTSKTALTFAATPAAVVAGVNTEAVALTEASTPSSAVAGVGPARAAGITATVAPSAAVVGTNTEAGAVTAASTPSAALAAGNGQTVALTEAITATSVVAATNTAKYTATFTSTPTAAVAGTNTEVVALTEASAPSASVAGTLSVAGVYQITCAIAAAAVVAGTNTETVAISGASSPSVSVAGTNTEKVALTEASAPSAVVAGTNTAKTALTFTATPSASTAGSNSEVVALTFTSTPAAVVAGTITSAGVIQLTCAIASSALVAAVNVQKVALTEAISSTSAVAASNTAKAALTAAIAPSLAVAGTNTQAKSMTAVIASSSALLGTNRESVALTDAISATVVIAANVTSGHIISLTCAIVCTSVVFANNPLVLGSYSEGLQTFGSPTDALIIGSVNLNRSATNTAGDRSTGSNGSNSSVTRGSPSDKLV